MYEGDFKTRCDEDVVFFIENVLGYKLSRVHKEMLQTVLLNRYVAIEVPVGHAKTTTISKGYVLWRLWREQRGFEICLASSSLEQSMKVLYEIVSTIESNDFLKELIPKNRNESWNKKQIETSKGTKFYVKPFNDSARGVHPDILIYDDILRVGDSDMSQQEVKDIFYSIFIPRGQTKRSQHILVGTPVAENDLFDDIEKKAQAGRQWKHIHYSAITKIKPFGEINNPDDWLEALWPERFPISELKSIRENISALRFAREYLCNPRADGTSMFNQKKLAEGLDEEKEFEYAKKQGFTIMGLDIAYSTQATADFTVATIVTLLQEPFQVTKYQEGRKFFKTISDGVYVERVVRQHGINTQTIKDLYDLYEVSKIILDKSTGGVLVAGDLRQLGCNVEEQAFDPASRTMLLLSLWKIIEQERLIIPFKKEGNSEQIVNIVLSELKAMQERKTRTGMDSYKSVAAHDDTVMSLCLAVKDFQRRVHFNDCPIYSIDSNSPTEKKQLFVKTNQQESKIVKIPGLD